MYSTGLMKTFVIHVGKRIFLYRVDDCATSVWLWAMLFLRGNYPEMPDSLDTRSRSPMRPSGYLVGSCGALGGNLGYEG